MKNTQHNAVQKKRQFITNELIKSGIYKKNNKHLYEWSMSELESEYQYMETKSLGATAKTSWE
jgi:hypothetical protein